MTTEHKEVVLSWDGTQFGGNLLLKIGKIFEEKVPKCDLYIGNWATQISASRLKIQIPNVFENMHAFYKYMIKVTIANLLGACFIEGKTRMDYFYEYLDFF